MRFVFVHGWGFEAGFWGPLRSALGDPHCEVLDLGFHGVPKLSLSSDAPYIAVGHSFGVQWLLHHRADHPWQALVSINGFAKFTKADDLPDGTDPRIVRRMIAGFDKNPHAVYRDFMALCGEDDPVLDDLDVAVLRESLLALKDWDERKALGQCNAPVLALAGDQDLVVGEGLSRATFYDAQLIVKQGGTHLLAQNDPQWCAAQIMAFVKDMTL